MSYDLVLLLDGRPTSDDVLAGLGAAGNDLRVRAVADGAVIQLCDDDGVPLVSIEIPLLIQVPGEVERMLGPDVGAVRTPTWWVEVRAGAEQRVREIADRYAENLIARLGGRVCDTSPMVAGKEHN
ncbi:hypothetical protein ACIA58_23965 [Kribbella sp. NPDC051586]|uniref:hypothetical protein n=1 Tax=Kribbella sp. NPDC051586 TaxID=3364118 RepID=UPI0037BE1B7E